MRIEERIESWVKRGFITEVQASKLRADVLLAQGQESEENLSRTGAGAILLVACALINGVVLVSSGYLTGVQGGIFGALGLWALSLGPMVYVLRHASLAGLLGCLVYVLVWMVVFADASLADMSTRIPHVPTLYLAAGVLSPRQCLHAALANNRGEFESGGPGAVAWINELLWREFYKHILVGFPQVSRGRAFRAPTEALPWRRAPAELEAWQQGRTGFPIIDAAMRQLLATGW